MDGRPETLGAGEDGAEGPGPAPDAVTGACMLVARELFVALGGLETLLRTNYNDVDLCLRAARAGRPAALAADAHLIHHESASRGRESTPDVRADWLLFRTRWAHLLVGGGAVPPAGARASLAGRATYSNEGPGN
ncbi:MAG: hypothetical protein RJQ03_03170 [Miltoncostaeaceae bacterium]